MAELASTGLPGLDTALNNLRTGDNVVWQVDSIDDYRRFVTPFVRQTRNENRKLIYVRFANHPPLIDSDDGVTTYKLDAAGGFESFSTQVHHIITNEGKGAYYVFDCLSDLLNAWATDLMIGNFFIITCPYLFELDTIAYFALLRKNHSFKTIARIRETTQLLLDLYDFENHYYIHPLKVWKRYSPTMFLPHLQQGERFVPLTSSADAARLISYISTQGLQPASRALDYWDRLFFHAEEVLKTPDADPEEKEHTIDQLCRIMIGREQRILSLAKKYFSLEDLLAIKNRLIGTGYIGGKAVGMLLANKILSDTPDFPGKNQLEPLDSFYVGSDVFYTYIVENGWWKLRMAQKTPEGYFNLAAELRERMLNGKFPDQLREQFQEIIEYFGQSPIIIRSSSLLEDAYGNAFAGKYESYFRVNQGTPEQRYRQFEDAVRKVYASTMSEDALAYRHRRGLDEQDEQMALLVQRVSGSHRKHFFFPDLAGVGISQNIFAWNPQLKPEAGLLRLVFGLGTRAVGRVEDDYPRIVALDQPLSRPVSGMDDVRKFAQSRVDLLDTEQNALRTVPFRQLASEDLGLKLDLVAVRDTETARKMKQLRMKDTTAWLLTFDKLLSDRTFTAGMQKILKTLEAAYNYPVDIEFTVNFTADNKPLIGLLQCRPLQTRSVGPAATPAAMPRPRHIIFQSHGYYMGPSLALDITRIIYVRPPEYENLQISEKYDIARTIGKLNKTLPDPAQTTTVLIGPGRWGTTTPSLGVPVGFAEISNVTLLAELAYEGGNLMPEMSFGTHFFQDLVENDIAYVAVFPGKQYATFDYQWFEQMPNRLAELLPESAQYQNVIKVADWPPSQIHLAADVVERKITCFE